VKAGIEEPALGEPKRHVKGDPPAFADGHGLLLASRDPAR